MRQRRADKSRRKPRTRRESAVQARIRTAESIMQQERQAFQSLVRQKQAFYESLLLELDKLLAEEERLLSEGRKGTNPP